MKEMKRIVQSSMMILFVALAACNFSAGTHTDLVTGLSVKYSGLSVEESFLRIGDQKLSSSEVSLGSKVELVLTGVQNFTDQGGKVFPGASMLVTGPGGELVVDQKDVLAEYDATGVDPTAARTLALKLTVLQPMAVGETYTWKSRVWDKKGKGEINAEVKIKVKA